MFQMKQGTKSEWTFLPFYKAPLTECSEIAFTPCTAVKMDEVYIKLVVGYDSAPEEGPARNCDYFVKKLPSLRGINGSQK